MHPEPQHLRIARCVAAYLCAGLTDAGHAVTVASVSMSEVALTVDGHPLRWLNRMSGFTLSGDWPRDIAGQHSAAEMRRIDRSCRIVPTDHLHRHSPPEPIERAHNP